MTQDMAAELKRRSSGAAAIEFAIALPVILLLSIAALQVLYIQFVQSRLQFAINKGARFAALLEGTNRAAATQQIISNELWTTGASSFEFCPVGNLNAAGECPSGAGSANPGGPNDYLYFKASTSVQVILWPSNIDIKAERIVRNEAF